MYQGQYHGSKKHEPDLDAVLQRAWYHGVDKMIVTGGSLQDAKNAIDLSKLDGK
jgi:TatD DNase family protein